MPGQGRAAGEQLAQHRCDLMLSGHTHGGQVVLPGGAPFVPLPVDAAVLGGWLVVSLGISARFFRWQ